MSSQDVLVRIGSASIRCGGDDLVSPGPPVLDEKIIPMDHVDPEALFEPLTKIGTAEQLRVELNRMREIFLPFMRNHAPAVNGARIRRDIARFDWRIETPEDSRDFQRVLSGAGEWESKAIPHYGGPLGKAVAYYRARFSLREEDFYPGAVFVCFRGADYKAHVFLNGCYLGSHEGFFAPFEFDCTACAAVGTNTLVVKLENDFVPLENAAEWTQGKAYAGDKLYGATGMGYDDPEYGWHHCPPGMGIYQDVFIESRPRLYVNDIFVRPMKDLKSAEAWIEICNMDVRPADIRLRLSLYGQNFAKTVFENVEIKPVTGMTIGLGDSLTEFRLAEERKLNGTVPLFMDKGVNRLIIPFGIPDARVWSMEHPWLYQLQVSLVLNGDVVDADQRHFGVRSFEMDTREEPKGMLYLNGKPIRLRGASTMGFEQQDVARRDWDRLRDDILLAKICNINYLRFIHRPVQKEVYDCCDMLGMMSQTEMPLFTVVSRSQFCEGVRQSGEMERMLRSHPGCVMADYIDEPFPNGMNKPQRNLTREEMEMFFSACDLVVRLHNPDRVVKHADGDYDPPSTDLPDSHCYCLWYNGHGLDIGMVHRGYWIVTKAGWHYSCGEYGSEALDPVSVMHKYYPADWLPESAGAEESWSPGRIRAAQTGDFHSFFYDTQDSLQGWVRESQRHQAWATGIMTNAFRRDNRMVCLCLHHFIDAWPAGWMKAIMDVERTPKRAYFAFRDALAPILPNIRTDRFAFYAGEEVRLESWVFNDCPDAVSGAVLRIVAEAGGRPLYSAKTDAEIPACRSTFQGYVAFRAPDAAERTVVRVRQNLTGPQGAILNDSCDEIEIFPRVPKAAGKQAAVFGRADGPAATLAGDLGYGIGLDHIVQKNGLILVDEIDSYARRKCEIDGCVAEGATALFFTLPAGRHAIADGSVCVKKCGMLPMHFVSRKTGHRLVAGFRPMDFWMWYDPALGYIAPIIACTFMADGYQPVLTGGNTDDRGKWGTALAVAERRFGKGRIIICQVELSGRTGTNPVAAMFASGLFAYGCANA